MWYSFALNVQLRANKLFGLKYMYPILCELDSAYGSYPHPYIYNAASKLDAFI